MKQIIFTLLLALIATSGWARLMEQRRQSGVYSNYAKSLQKKTESQVKSGLDFCLRDEATGEWLIGLYDDYAIYDCEYWDYAAIQKDNIELKCGDKRVKVQLKRKGQAVTAVAIDGVKHKTSVLTTKCLPDYPSKDETAWPTGIYAEEDSITLRVCVRTTKERTEYISFIERLLDGKQVNEHMRADNQGRFEMRMPVSGPSVMGIRNEFEHPLEHFFSGMLAVENKDTLLLYIDDVNDRTYLMGGQYARFNNELLGGDFHPDFLRTDELSIDSTIIRQNHWMAVCQTRLDSLYKARPNLSRRFRTYYQDNILNQYAHPMLLKCCWPKSGENQNELLSKTEAVLNPLRWMRSEVPLMCRDDFDFNISYYISALEDVRSTDLPDPADFILQLSNEGKVKLTDEELQKIKDFQTLLTKKSEDDLVNKTFQSDIIPIMGKPLIAQYWDWKLSEQSVPLHMDILHSLDMDDTTREILKTQTFMKKMDGKSHVTSPRVMELAHQEVRHPRLIHGIESANQRIADFLAENQRHQALEAPKEGTPASLRVAEENLKDITSGKELFEHIIAPFRGYVIYVDVWGTWCGPCRAAMENVSALKKMLEGKPVVYLYFCNNSPEDAWRTFIRQKHLDTDNAIHYNLPRAQENAIEQFLEVSGFPTYRLVDTTGKLMPGGAPWPSNTSAAAAAIEQLLPH